MTKKLTRIVTSILFISILISTFFVGNASAILPQNTQAWYWNSDTEATSVVTANVDADGAVEVVTGGYYNDGTRWVAQLAVWNGATMSLENVRVWYWNSNTQISSIAVGDVDGDGAVEIVTGGSYFDGTRWVAQLVVWSGATLAFENVKTWYWNSNTYVNSVAIANVDADPAAEIVSGGAYFDGTRWNAQLVVWTGSTLAVENIQAWYWTDDTDISSVVAGDIDADGAVEILTGGSFFDSVRNNAQLAVWTGSSLALENTKNWYFISNTTLSSVAFGDVNADGFVDVVTGGKFFDGNRYNAQITIQPGSTLAGNTGSSWYWVSDTYVKSIAIGNVAGAGNRIVTSGAYYDLTRAIAQITVWG